MKRRPSVVILVAVSLVAGAAGAAGPPGGGRSFATALGHPWRNFQNDSFRRMLVHGILWTAGIEVPADGAPVNVPENVLALPAPPPAPAR